MGQRRRIAIACVVGVIAGLLCYSYSVGFGRGAGDVAMPLCMGKALIARQDPYAICRGFHSDGITPNQANPLTTALITLPLVAFAPTLAAGIFFGISSALLAYAVTQGGADRLMIFLAFPYWQALQTVQWAPLLVAIALMPALLPLALAKPHVALPIFLTRLTLRRLIACIAFVLFSLAIDPTWPLRLTGRIPTPGDYLPPLAALPLGPLLLLAALRWRAARPRLLLLLAITPQRMFYDPLLAWLIPQSRRELLLMAVASWLCYFGWIFMPQHGMTWVVAGIYLPALALCWRDTPDLPADPRVGLLRWWRQVSRW
jgi:hypothetical protein